MSQKLLLADDSVTIQRVIELTFADEGITVVAVGDGRQAIDRISAERPDIVLADVGMPGCDGYEVSRFVKQTPDLAHIPVLLLTGAFEPVDEARAAEAGCDGVLAKPFEPQQLIAKVRQLLSGAAEHGSAAPAGDAMSDPSILAAIGAGPGVSALLDAAPPAEGRQNTPSEDLDLVAEPAEPRDRSSLDDYFDKLDAAFANLTVTPAPEATPHEAGHDDAPRFDASAYDSMIAEPAADAHDLEPVPVLSVATESPAPPSPLGIADAFSALLEAERNGTVSPALASRLAGPAGPSPDELTDLVYERVVERLADRAVTSQVPDVVRQTAERLIRAEIDAIKARIEAAHR